MYKLFNGDCIEILQTIVDDSIDSIVTDPPYELGFMGKSWDSTGIAFDTKVWKECLRVLKPGGYLLAFGGSRTYHRMAVAIEDAGFEIRDQIMWIYGSGFPKSLDVSKAIDKAAGVQRTVIGSKKVPNIKGDAAKQWQGWGTALKPAHEPIVMARKPLIGTVAENVLTYGTGAINIDGTRVEGKLEGDPNRFAKTDGGSFNTSLALENHKAPIVRLEGRWPANVIHDGSDEVIDLFPQSKGGAYPAIRGKSEIGAFSQGGTHIDKPNQARIMGDDGSAARFFYCAKASKTDRNEGLEGFPVLRPDERSQIGMGTFEEKGVQPQENYHPTVKPTNLMRYLIKLVTQPKGIVLDPFNGSGSTGKACMLENFEYIGIEKDEGYYQISKVRIEQALKNQQENLFDA